MVTQWVAHSHAVPDVLFNPYRLHQQGHTSHACRTLFMDHGGHNPTIFVTSPCRRSMFHFLHQLTRLGYIACRSCWNISDNNWNCAVGGSMLQYTPRYPKAFGHPAWKLYGSVNDVLQQDLLWRKVQTDPALVASFAKLLDPEVRQEGEDIFLSDGFPQPYTQYQYKTQNQGNNQ